MKMVNSRWLRVEGGRVFLIFDFRFLIESREKLGVWKQVAGPEAGVPTKTREVSSCRKRRGGRCGFTALSGWKVGKAWNFYRLWAGSTRLFPHKSTQVVDFPRLSVVRVFCEDEDSPPRRRAKRRKESTANHTKYANAQEGDRMDDDYGQNGRKGRSRPIRHIRVLVAIFETERSLMCAYVRLKSPMFQ